LDDGNCVRGAEAGFVGWELVFECGFDFGMGKPDGAVWYLLVVEDQTG
jgi:hypothetical protein